MESRDKELRIKDQGLADEKWNYPAITKGNVIGRGFAPGGKNESKRILGRYEIYKC